MVKSIDSIIIEIKSLIEELQKDNIDVNTAILYGSYAKGQANEWSDIDVALVSDNFSGNMILDFNKYKKAIFKVDPNFSLITFKNEDFTASNLFVKEILKQGIRVL
jgi:predicted nucleotidyltransferase